MINLPLLVERWLRGTPQRRERYYIDAYYVFGQFAGIPYLQEAGGFKRGVIHAIVNKDHVLVYRHGRSAKNPETGAEHTLVYAGDPDFFNKLEALLDRKWEEIDKWYETKRHYRGEVKKN